VIDKNPRFGAGFLLDARRGAIIETVIFVVGRAAPDEDRVNMSGTELALAPPHLRGTLKRISVTSICAMHHLSPGIDGIAYRRSFLQ
jgi:hypothetical protein